MMASGEDSVPINRYLTAGIAVNTSNRSALKKAMTASVSSRFTGAHNEDLLKYIKPGLYGSCLTGTTMPDFRASISHLQQKGFTCIGICVNLYTAFFQKIMMLYFPLFLDEPDVHPAD